MFIGFSACRAGGTSTRFLTLSMAFYGLGLTNDGFKLPLSFGGDPEQVDRGVVLGHVEWGVLLAAEGDFLV